MDYRFFRDLKHNYLVVKNEGDMDKPGVTYQLRILESGKLKGFLSSDMRNINNESFLYYEINSMQSLKDRYAVNGMSSAELKRLFESMKEALLNLSEFLLGIENVVLDTNSIYTDLSTGEFKFMYYPFKEAASDFSCFLEELFNLVDHDDETAVEMIYSCSEKAQVESALVLECIEQTLLACDEKAVVDLSEPETLAETAYDETDDLGDFTIEEYEEEKSYLPNIRKKVFAGNKKLDGKVQILFAFLFLILVGVMVFIRMNYILTEEENILSVIVMVVSTITGLVAVLSGIKDLMKAGAEDTRLGSDEHLDGIDDDYDFFDGQKYVADFSADGESKEPVRDKVDLKSYRKPVKVTPSGQMVMPGCGETVVLDEEDDPDREITLYSRNAEKTLRITLDKLPITLGKMEGCVDHVINDISVSRIHCRFFRNEEGRLSVVDLNSTNGTFRNGLKLLPQKEQLVEEGDEIRIGKICFDCR